MGQEKIWLTLTEKSWPLCGNDLNITANNLIFDLTLFEINSMNSSKPYVEIWLTGIVNVQ